MAKTARMPRTAAPTKRGTGKPAQAPTNGAKISRKASRRGVPKTANEALLIAWQHFYESQHVTPKAKR